MSSHVFIVAADTPPQSLEAYVAAQLGGIDRLVVRRWVQAGLVTVDGGPAKASRYVRPGQQIAVRPPAPRPHDVVPEALDLPIRYQDDHLVVVAKPAGMATHPGPGWWRGSCVNALLHAISDWPGVGGVAGPGIVHRLDRDTTGLVIFAKTDRAHQALLAAARDRRIRREYLAWVDGRMEGTGTISAPLGRDPDHPQKVAVRDDGKPAITHWETLVPGDERSSLRLHLETGRNHQIRVHLAASGHPVWGDPVYGRVAPFLALHAWRLAFAHPVSGETLTLCESPPPHWSELGPHPWA